MAPIWRVAGLSLFAAGCVATAESRPSLQQAALGPPPPPDRAPTAMGTLARSPASRSTFDDGAEPAPRPPDQLWVRGYWHWDEVRYVWVPGRFEPKRPSYAWQRPSAGHA